MKILYIATVSYAGMLPFASSIINSMKGKDIYCILINSKFGDYKKSIDSDLHSRCFFLVEGNFLVRNIEFLFPYRFNLALKKACSNTKFDIIHFLTEDSIAFSIIPKLKNKFKIEYTLHDFFSHEENVSIFVSLKRKIIKSRIGRIVKNVKYISTCSKEQEDLIKEKYPFKIVSYFPFPSLITKEIIDGNLNPIELKVGTEYLLFFGRIEKYKGIDLLLQAYSESNLNEMNIKLVIAGKGNINIDDIPEGVVTINRYVRDIEISQLFQNSLAVIYPYLSATQTGVLSLSYYFGKPSIVSNIPFFMENFIENVTGNSFENGSCNSLSKALLKITSSIELFERKKIHEYYELVYNPLNFKNKLLEHYNFLN